MALEFNVVFEELSQELLVNFQELEENIPLIFDDIQIVEDASPEYKGDYEVTPRIVAQTMPTANKRMAEDVKVKAIPYYEVANKFEGKTIIIGGAL